MPCRTSPAHTAPALRATERASRPRLGPGGSEEEPTRQAAPTARDQEPSLSFGVSRRLTLAPCLESSNPRLALRKRREA